MLAPETDNLIPSTCVRAGSGWKAVLQGNRYNHSPSGSVSHEDTPGIQGLEGMSGLRRQSHSSLNNENDPSQALITQREEILWLWKEEEIHEVLRRRDVKVENMAGL